MAAASIYDIAMRWDTASDAERQTLRAVIRQVAGIPAKESFKLACQPTDDGFVDIVVFNEEKRRVTDWFELQRSGAIGVLFDEYPESVKDSVLDRLDAACDAYNASVGVVFEEASESDDEESEGLSSSSSEDSETEEDSETKSKEKTD